MHAHPLHPDRTRRTEAVVEILRRRAALRRARGEVVPPALRRAIEDSDLQRPRHPPPGASR